MSKIAMLDGLSGRGGRKGSKWKRGKHRAKLRRGPGASRDWDSDEYGDYYDMRHTSTSPTMRPRRFWAGDGYAGLGADEAGDNTMLIVGVVAVAAVAAYFFMSKPAVGEEAGGEMGPETGATTARAYATAARNQYVAMKSGYTKSLYE